MEWEIWQPLVAQALELIIPLVVTALGVILVNYLKKRGVRQDLVNAIEQAYNLLQDCVIATNQTYVTALKESGKFDAEAAEQAKKITIGRFKALMSEEMALAISTAYNSLDTWLKIMIEADVWTAKLEVSAAA